MTGAADPAAIDPVEETMSVPALTVVLPVKVFEPERIQRPMPALLTPMVPPPPVLLSMIAPLISFASVLVPP